MSDVNLLDVGDYDDPHWQAANELLSTQRFREAAAFVQQLDVEARPPTLNIAGVAATVLQARPLAEAFFRRALAADPDFVQTYNNLALFLRVGGRQAEAEQVFHQGLKRAPDEPTMSMGLVNLLWLEERHAEAEARLREHVRRHPA